MSGSGGVEEPVKVTVCVGSSCHVRGSRALLNRFAKIITAQGLDGKVTLDGSFCLERCGECMNWKLNEEDVSSPSVEEGEETFRRRLQQAVRKTDT